MQKVCTVMPLGRGGGVGEPRTGIITRGDTRSVDSHGVLDSLHNCGVGRLKETLG